MGHGPAGENDLQLASRKRELRAAVRPAIRALSDLQIAQLSDALSQRVIALPELAAARTVMVFGPAPGEVDVRPVARRCLALGKAVCLPRVGWDSGELTPCCVSSVDSGLFVRQNGVPEPSDDAHAVSATDVDLVLVPGLAFDPSGGRLGRGGGFYDRFLAGLSPRALRVGVAFDEQVVPMVPRGPMDVMVHAVVTPTRTLRPNATEGDHGRT